MPRARPTLVIMTRRPRFGQGKRRLAREAGEMAAWRFQRRTLAALVRRLGGDPRWQLRLAVTPDEAARGSGQWAFGLPRQPQGPGDLGQRMRRQLARFHGSAAPLLLIGSDVPSVTRASVSRAFDLLRRHDWVIGPAEDGGFWAIGARRRPWRPPDLGRIAWSTGEALQQTLPRLPGTIAMLERRRDVDDLNSLSSAASQSVNFR